MAAKLIRLTHRIAIKLHLVAERFLASGGQSGKLLDTPLYGSGSPLEKLLVAGLVKKFHGFYGTQMSIPYSQEPVRGLS
jgi:hypothetical protein